MTQIKRDPLGTEIFTQLMYSNWTSREISLVVAMRKP
jgi:hypothetical protein